MYWMATLTTLFLVGVSYLTFQANIEERGLNNGLFAAMLIIFLVVILAIVVFSARRFRLPQDARQ